MSTYESSINESLLTRDQEDGNSIKTELLHKQSLKKGWKQQSVNGQSCMQAILFTWIYSLLRYGSKNPVTEDSLPKLPFKLQTEYEYNKLHQQFAETQKSKKEGFTLIKALLKTYAFPFAIILLIVLVYISFSILFPFLTAMIMKYIKQSKQDKDMEEGLVLFFVILASNLFQSLAQTHMNYRFTSMGLNIANSLTMMIYQKALKYASLSQKKFTQADIINYSQVDAERMTYMGNQLASLLIAPLQIIAGLFIMYNFIGVSFVSGVGVMVLMIVCTFFSSKRTVKYNEQVLKAKDERMNVTQQMLNIIRYIKINAIQKFFFKKVDAERMNEIQLYKKKGQMEVMTIFIFWLAGPAILSATFFTYIKLGFDMNSQVAFTTIMIFSILQFPIRLLPNCISEIIQMYASIKRIQKYLLTQEMKVDHVVQKFEKDSDIAIKIQRGDFYWGLQKNKQEKQNKEESKKKKIKLNQISNVPQDSTVSQSDSENQNQLRQSQIFTIEEITNLPASSESRDDQDKPKYVHALKDINTSIKKSKFTILIGDIGSGKTSFLLAILNELRSSFKTNIEINGSIAYASQKPWILSGTVRDNIIFTQPYQEGKFKRVIHYASLEHDIKILPKGFDTQIGEKGVNLSGGQKARIGLARALYSQRDIYLFDDILSAVDVHVGQFLMKQTLLGYLKGKTIIMPTHAVKFSEFVDEIMIMKKGRIVRKGHYNDIYQTQEFQHINLKENRQKRQQSVAEDEEKLEKEYEMFKDVMKNKSDNQVEGKAVQDRLVQELMLPQDHVIGKVDFTIFKQYINLNGGMFKFAFLVSLSMFLWIVSTTMASIIMQKWCQDPIGQENDLYIYMSLSIFSNLFILFRLYTLILSGAKQGEKVHKSMMKSLLYASLGNFYNRIPIGRIINRLTKDLRQLDEAIGIAIGSLLVGFFLLLGTLTICIYGSTPFIILPIVIALCCANCIRNFYMKTQRQVSRLEKSTNSPIVSGYMSVISGLSTIRAYKKQSNFSQIQMKFIDINKMVRLNKTALESWFTLTLTYLSFLVNMSAIGYCILSANDNPSLAGLLMNYALGLSNDIINFILSHAYFETKIISLERIYTFMKIPPEPSYNQYCLNWRSEEEGYQMVVTEGEIQFKDTCVKYRKDLPIVLNFKGSNCKIKKGEKIGIVGRTGAGKTTLINTLLRITEIADGDVLIDGKSILSLPLKDLRNDITMIDQEPTLIKSTFQENLDITGKYTNQQLQNILKECNLYQTIVEKGGLLGKVSNDSLSVGQKQLLCICRAFLKQSRIVLIDEATANIDLKNDEIIQRVIHDKFKECTVLTIAHRLSTLKNSDKIMVMENGRIIQFGPPEELQRKPNGFYREMMLKNASEFLI